MYSTKVSLGLAEYEQIIRRDEELVAAVKAGSHAAFEEIRKCYSDRLYKRILMITKHREDSEDALQETFLRAFAKIESFEGRALLSTWLTRIAINSALMCLRKRRIEVSLHEQTESGVEIYSHEIRDTSLNPEEFCDLKQRWNSIHHAIDRLDPISRSAIGYRISKGYSIKEIAHTLDVSLATVKSKLHRARKSIARTSASRSAARIGSSFHRKSNGLGLQRREQRCLER